MVQTGAEKGCCGNFALGVPGVATDPSLQCFADCCDKMCPPDCCDTYYFYYKCGEESDEDPCCGGQTLRASGVYPDSQENTNYFFPGDALVELPDFTLNDQPMVRALGSLPVYGSVVGSIPYGCGCEEITVTLTTDYCCFVNGGIHFHGIIHVGDGIVTVYATPDSGLCGKYVPELSVNGGPWMKSAAAQDNDIITVRLSYTGNGECPNCECCQTGSEDPCNYRAELFTPVTTSKGSKLIINKEALLRRYHTIRQTQVIRSLLQQNKLPPSRARSVKRTAPIRKANQAPIF